MDVTNVVETSFPTPTGYHMKRGYRRNSRGLVVPSLDFPKFDFYRQFKHYLVGALFVKL